MKTHPFLWLLKAICFILLLALAVHAEEAFYQALENSGWNETEKNQLTMIVQQAEQDGLPTSPLHAKVYEGMAKNIPAERIIRAVSLANEQHKAARTLSTKLSQAPLEQNALFEHAVEAMTAGIPAQSIMAVMSHQHFSHPGVAQETLALMRDLARRGSSAEEVENLAQTIAKSRLSKREIGELRTEITRHGRWGKSDTFTRDITRRVSRGERGSAAVRGSSSGGSSSQKSTNSSNPSRKGSGSSGGSHGSSKGGGSGSGR
ncbi:hypothetical protein [Chrysiogenes arsenatis]|uniref:hypothetical protein n=1 Tax=Chrysiogenes arsenatis TaxID=309797 RepID=UPI000402F888|nr:hypothetical protein [Chrysiogenes arsenatis]